MANFEDVLAKDPLRDAENLEFLKESTRNLLEIIRVGELSNDELWQNFLVYAARASVAKKLGHSRNASDLTDITLGTVIVYDANKCVKLANLHDSNRVHQLSREVPQMEEALAAMATEPHYNGFKEELATLMMDLKQVALALAGGGKNCLQKSVLSPSLWLHFGCFLFWFLVCRVSFFSQALRGTA